MEKVLRGCAEAGVPENVDLWPDIREQTAVEGGIGSLRTRFLPRTRIGLVFAALLAMLVTGTGAVAASRIADDLFRGAAPGAEGAGLGVKFDQKLDQKQTIDGVTVTLERAYADQNNVVVSYSTEGPIVGLMGGGKLTDENGKLLSTGGMNGGQGAMEDKHGAAAATAVFGLPEKIAPSEEQRFHFETLVVRDGDRDDPATDPVTGLPFAFDFEVPVLPVPVIEMHQKVEADGVTLILDRIENSPGKPEAVICFDPPDDGRMWGEFGIGQGSMDSGYHKGNQVTIRPTAKNGCNAVSLPEPNRAGGYSIVVTDLYNAPRDAVKDMEEGRVAAPYEDRTIHGPWKFDFEVPKR